MIDFARHERDYLAKVIIRDYDLIFGIKKT